MAADALFRLKAPDIMRLLMKDFDFDETDAAAVVGNLGHESGGFRFLQELKPMIPGSRGGYGWAQWTGPRRVAFEKYCERNKLDPASDKANYGFLFVELTGSEKKAVDAVRNALGLYNKVVAFEKNFERAGIKHYDRRMIWAEKALEAYKVSAAPPPPDIAPAPPKPTTAPPRGFFHALGKLLEALLSIFKRKD